MKIAAGLSVQIEYELSIKGGDVIESSARSGPLRSAARVRCSDRKLASGTDCEPGDRKPAAFERCSCKSARLSSSCAKCDEAAGCGRTRFPAGRGTSTFTFISACAAGGRSCTCTSCIDPSSEYAPSGGTHCVFPGPFSERRGRHV